MSASETPEIVARALGREDVAALQTLAASGDKSTSKAAKRALHRLRSRGVAIPEASSAISASAAPAVEDAREPVLATTYDASGHRAIFLPLKAKLGFTLHVAVLSDESGVVSLGADELSRKQVRATIAELPTETRELLRELTPAQAAASIAGAIALAPESANAARARDLLRSLPGPATVSTAVDTAVDEARLRESAKLFETAPFRGYLPPREVLIQVSQQLEEMMVSPLLVDDQQRLAQLRHALERATAAFFTGARRASYAVRLLDAAELFEARGDPASASRAHAAAAALRSDRPIHEIPFARDLFERIFDLQAALKALAPPVKPGSGPASAPGGAGGLILP